MKKQTESRIVSMALILGVLGSIAPASAAEEEQRARTAVLKYNVVWDSPSKDYNGTMPIGNGDLAANVWVEPNGELIFLISKSDAWSGGADDGPDLLKLGRVRVKLDPPLYAEGTTFKQELDLESGAIRVHSAIGNQQTAVLFWLDANRPVINVEIDSSAPRSATVALESWRADGEYLVKGAREDVIVPTDGETIRWYHRNEQTSFNRLLEVQRLGHLVGKYADPILNLTFGCLITGDGLEAVDDRTLQTTEPATRVRIRCHALTEQTETADAWLDRIARQRQGVEAVARDDAWAAHTAWWQDFWERSTIHITGTPEAEKVAQAYQLQRWIQAGAGRGAYPVKFNGSLFTVDGLDSRWVNPEGVHHGPDYRRWGGPYWWQNTRLVYWPMLYSGDYEMMQPLFKLYRDMLPLLRERTRHYFGHDGIFISETATLWGLQRNQDFGFDNKSFTSFCPYTRWEWQGGLELSAMMLDYYRHTLDESVVKDTLLPIADEVILFYDQHYPRDNRSNGKLVITPAQALETWHVAVDPLPEVAGLHAVVEGLLDLPDHLSSEAQRKRWTRLQGELPPIPIGQEDGKRWIKPARIFDSLRNAETPELYCVYPYRTHMIGKPDLDAAIEAYNRRRNKRTGGWFQDSIFAAMLGLTDDAKKYVIENATAKNWNGQADHPQSRFPAFWGPNADWIPDQDHGSVFITAVQRMLMVTDGKAIHLLPAWPEDWTATFKLHAPYRTVVEGRVENGKVVELAVTPESRRKDVHAVIND